MQPDCDFLILDSAYSEKSSADLSVLYWCSKRDGVLRILKCAAGRWGVDAQTLGNYVISFAHQQVHIPTTTSANDFIPMPQVYVPLVISTIRIEGEFIASTLKKYILEKVPGVAWNIEPIAVNNAKGAKWLRISRAYEAIALGQIDIRSLPEPHRSCLRAQLEAVNHRDAEGKVLEYRDAEGHDDYADCLGLARDVAFADTLPAAPPAPKVEATKAIPGACGDPLAELRKTRAEEEANIGNDPYPDSGGGSGICM